ncbi:MAG: DUF58 domain-containing protein, partial [Actinomycetota bacterium]|nr:DUF58 domain-containing protein [Actinomycetota bacterium]
MAITGRFVLLALAGLIPLLLFPAAATIFLWLLLLAVVLALDLVLAASARTVVLRRTLPDSVRLGESTSSVLTIANGSRRRMRALVREAWQPSANALNPRQRVLIPPGERSRITVRLRPTRRGDLHTPHTTIRSYGPLGMAARQLTIAAPGRLRVLPPFNSKRHLPSRLRKLRELDGRAAVQ